MASCSESLFDCHGKAICKWQEGSVSSSSLNYRIYWDGDVFDEYNDRGHVDKWYSATHSWGRLQTYYNNGSSTINSTKYNPNIQADFLGDWREEVVFYRTTDNALIINATTIPSYYKIPFLMDDRQYDEAIVWQNVGYNQPPHLSYDLTSYFTKTLSAELQNDGSQGNGWGAYYTTAPMRVPEGTRVYYVTNLSASDHRAALSEVTNGVILPNQAFVFYGAGDIAFKPAATPSTTTVSNLLTGSEKAKDVKSGAVRKTYTLQKGGYGVGFYYVETASLKANEPYLSILSTSLDSEYYLLEDPVAASALTTLGADAEGLNNGIYTLQGVRVLKVSKPGLYVVNGKLKLCKGGETE